MIFTLDSIWLSTNQHTKPNNNYEFFSVLFCFVLTLILSDNLFYCVSMNAFYTNMVCLCTSVFQWIWNNYFVHTMNISSMLFFVSLFSGCFFFTTQFKATISKSFCFYAMYNNHEYNDVTHSNERVRKNVHCFS